MGLGATAEDAHPIGDCGTGQRLARAPSFFSAGSVPLGVFFHPQLGPLPSISREEFGPQKSRNPSVRGAAHRLLMQRVQASRIARRPSEEKA